MFREAVRAGTDLGRRAQEYLRRGDLVPDAIVQEMVEARLSEPDCRDGFILDGYPRTLPQAAALDRFLGTSGHRLDAVVFFEIRDEVLLRRLTGRRVCPVCGANYHVDYKPPRVEGRCDLDGAELVQRIDDAPETVRHRLEVFRQWTAPLVEYYEVRRLFLRVDAERPVDEVYERIREFVHSRVSRAPLGG
jgi:adenylate kinase